MAGRARREWGSGSIYRTAKGYWRVSVPLASPLGRRRQEWQYRTEAAARRQLEAVQRRLDRGLPTEESVVTVAEYAQEWLGSLDKRPATLAMYGSIVRHQLGDVGTMRLVKVGVPDIRALLKARERERYSGRTRRAILDVLRMIFRMAEADGLRSDNPAALVDAPRIDAKEPVHLTAEQARKFLEVSKDEGLHSLFAVALGTGLRRGELLALTWRDVDLDQGVVRVRKSKTGAGVRTVPLPAFAADVLRGLARRPGPIWLYSPAYVTRRTAAICERAGLPRVTTHGLRHSTASILLAEGVPMEIIRQILGHTTATMTGHYARAEDEMKREAMERLGRAVAS